MQTKLLLAGAAALTAVFTASAPASATPLICQSLESAGLTGTSEYKSQCAASVPEPSIVVGCLALGAAMMTQKAAKSK